MVNFFLEKGWRVIGLCRNPRQQQVLHPHLSFSGYSLEQGLEDFHLEGVDTLLHLAFLPASSKAPYSNEINLNEVKNLISIAKNTSVQVVYFSSMSAHPMADSQYGKHKYLAESMLKNESVLVVKPGLVIGDGGMVEKLKRLMGKSTIIPLIGGGYQPIQTLSMKDLCRATYHLINENEKGLWPMAESNPTTLINLYKTMAEIMQINPFFLKVPYSLAYVPAYFADQIGLSLPITLENLKGLKKLSTFDTTATEKVIKFTFGNFKENLETYREFIKHD